MKASLSALLFICFFWQISADTFANNRNAILIVGDSISAAYGIDQRQGWVHLLNERLAREGYSRYHVVNASISGSTSGDGLNRLPSLLSKHEPEIVVIELGGNDGLRGYPIPIMRRNLQGMIELSVKTNAKVLLAGIEIPPNYGPRYTTAFRQAYYDLADANEVSFLPFILKGVATKPALMQNDGIHPTAKAQQILLDNVWQVLQPLLSAR